MTKAPFVSSPRVGWLQNERTRRRAGWTLGGSAITALLCAFLMFPFDSPALFVTSCVAALVAIVSATILGASAHSAARRVPGSVEVIDGQIIVTEPKGLTRIPLTDVVDGWIEHPHDVRVRLKDARVLAVEAPDPATAEALLVAAGVGPSQRVLAVPTSSAASLTRGGVPSSILGIALLSPLVLASAGVASVGVVDVLTDVSGPGIAAMLFMFMIVAAGVFGIAKLIGGLRLGRAIVGVDGVTLKRGRQSTFVPYASITRVEPSARGVWLHRHDGPSLELPTWRRGEPALAPGAAPSEGQRRQRVLIDRIERASRASRRSSTDLAMLDRSGRSMETWRAEVGALAGREGRFRAASLTTADLADVVEDVEAPAERRIAAAMAVADSGDTTARQRMRIAIDTCANDDLRVALERAAEAELEEDDLERVIQR